MNILPLNNENLSPGESVVKAFEGDHRQITTHREEAKTFIIVRAAVDMEMTDQPLTITVQERNRKKTFK